MPRGRKPQGLTGLRQAFDEARFGNGRTLNLRETLPTAAEAVARTEAWLRQQQTTPPASGVHEALIITGRGNASEGGVSVVRSAVEGLLHRLKHRGVIRDHHEHTPGSFVVTVAPLRALWETPPRRRHPEMPPEPPSPRSLDALAPTTRRLLRDLAERSLEQLGVRDRDRFVEGEMLKQFGAIAATLAGGPQRETQLHDAIRLAIEQYD